MDWQRLIIDQKYKFRHSELELWKQANLPRNKLAIPTFLTALRRDRLLKITEFGFR